MPLAAHKTMHTVRFHGVCLLASSRQDTGSPAYRFFFSTFLFCFSGFFPFLSRWLAGGAELLFCFRSFAIFPFNYISFHAHRQIHSVRLHVYAHGLDGDCSGADDVRIDKSKLRDCVRVLCSATPAYSHIIYPKSV